MRLVYASYWNTSRLTHIGLEKRVVLLRGIYYCICILYLFLCKFPAKMAMNQMYLEDFKLWSELTLSLKKLPQAKAVFAVEKKLTDGKNALIERYVVQLWYSEFDKCNRISHSLFYCICQTGFLSSLTCYEKNSQQSLTMENHPYTSL